MDLVITGHSTTEVPAEVFPKFGEPGICPLHHCVLNWEDDGCVVLGCPLSLYGGSEGGGG